MAATFPGGDALFGAATADSGASSEPAPDANTSEPARDANASTPERQLAFAVAALDGWRPQEVIDQLPPQLEALMLASASMWAALGRAHEQLQQADPAERGYTQAVALLDLVHTQPSPAQAAALAMALTHAGRNDTALALLEAAAEQPNGDPAVANILGEQLIVAGDRVVGAIEDPARKTETLCKVAEAQRQQGRFEEALVTFGRALVLQPQSASALVGSGATLASLNRNEQAIEALRAALAVDEEMPWAHAMLAEQLRLRNELPAALAALERAQKLGDTSAWLRGTRGQILLAQGDPAGAIAELHAAWALENAPWIAYELASAVILAPTPHEVDEALAILNRALTEAPEAQSLLATKADLLSAAGRYGETLDTIDRYLTNYPDDRHARETRAQALLGLDDVAGARREAEELIANYPDSTIARRTRTLALVDMDEYKEALREAEMLCQLNSANGDAQLLKAALLFGLQRLHQTATVACEQLRLDPTQALANGLAGMAERRIAGSSLDAAVAHLRAALAAEPDNLTWQIELADALDELGSAPEEVRTLREGVAARVERRELSDYESLAIAAWAALWLDRLEPAVKWINEAILMAPKLASLRFLSGLTLLGAGRPEVALDAYSGGIGLVAQIDDRERAASIVDEALRDLNATSARWSTPERPARSTPERPATEIERAKTILQTTYEGLQDAKRASNEEDGERVAPAEHR
ncbi:MAG TPA: tetratricopeptide repeat protein [Solirubrobacteraceae bacterium]|jgi:tetratricopeptide (TPR) repeat protein|nr:tetratricopeptide repeat protein [Solirubrobacteraceae bacterium]